MLVIDLETAGLHYTDKVVLCGVKKDGRHFILDRIPEWIFNDPLWVGHNIKFDLKFIRHAYSDEYKQWIANGGTVFDTQVAEYLITGQEALYASLDQLAEKYGGTQKDSRVTDMFKAGMTAADVPREMLADYLKADLDNTELAYKEQLEQLTAVQLFETQMDALLFLTECEYNGMAIDVEENEKIIKRLEEEINAIDQDLVLFPGSWFNPNSVVHLGVWIYGGTVTYNSRVCVGRYKTGAKKGQKRYRIFKEEADCHGITDEKPNYTDKGNIVVDSSVLERFKDDKVVGLVLRRRELNKLLNTYHRHLNKPVVHHTLQQTSTVTGRLSSTNPNMQNLPRDADVKRVIISRLPNGRIIELDFSQLEIVMLAYLSKDEQLMKDIEDGIDLHTLRAAELFNVEKPTKQQRTIAKSLSFQLQYGAGPKSMAEKLGIPKELAERFIENYYRRYPKVKKFQEQLKERIERSKKRIGIKNGYPQHKSKITSITGRIYTFVEKEAPDWLKQKGKYWSFKPTEIANYMVQGTATGDFVPMVCGYLYREAVKHRIPVLFINTVHDSIVMEAEEKNVNTVIGFIRNRMNKLDMSLFPDWRLPIRYEIKVGKNWKEGEVV